MQLPTTMSPSYLSSAHLKMSSLSFHPNPNLLFLLCFPPSWTAPTIHSTCKLENRESSLTSLSPSHSTSNSSSSLFSCNSTISLKSTHFSHSLLPLFYSELFHHLSLNNSILTGLCNSTMVALPQPILYTAARSFKNINKIVLLSGLKFINSSPLSLKESLNFHVLMMDKRSCRIWSHSPHFVPFFPLPVTPTLTNNFSTLLNLSDAFLSWGLP